MITDKESYLQCLRQDALANRRTSLSARLFGDDIWKFIRILRKNEYLSTFRGWKRIILLPYIKLQTLRLLRASVRCGYTIPMGTFDAGLSIAHRGTIAVNPTARIGKNCRIHEGVTIGSTGGSKESAVIGDNVFIATGAKIIGNVRIADNVAIGANAVVVKDILEPGTTWAGVPARKVSNKDSRGFLSPLLGLDAE